MDSVHNYEVIYCADDDEYRIYCEICDKICIERFHKNHLKSLSHTSNIYKRKQLNITKNLLFSLK